MIDVTIKVTVLAVVAALLTRRTRPEDASAAHLLWLFVLLSPLLLLAMNVVMEPVAFLVPRSGSVSLVGAALEKAGTAALVIYGFVALLLLARVAAGYRSVCGILRNARPLPEEVASVLRQVADTPRLRLAEGDLDVPITAGVLKPVVLLPAGWRALSETALKVILRHEAAHVRRRDCLVALACALAEAVFWFSPAAWWASSRVRWFAELACDDEASRSMGDGVYAAELLNLAAGWVGVKLPRHAMTAGVETHVARRIRLLIDGVDPTGPRHMLPAALVAAIVLALLSATVRLSASRAPSMAGALFDHAPTHVLRHRH